MTAGAGSGSAIDEDGIMLSADNCGSPIELDEGWLVPTHGVGPMGTYSIGALLLDLTAPPQK